MENKLPVGIPAGYTCYFGDGRACVYQQPHPLTQKNSCAAQGNTQLDDAFKCPACLEACGLENPDVRWSR